MQERELAAIENHDFDNPMLQKVRDLFCFQLLSTIKKHLTFHLARHTFATTVTLVNCVPIETTSKMLGHTKLSTTMIYAKVTQSKIGLDMQLLQNKLDTIQSGSKMKAV